jgi:hypothetical protein
MVRIFVFLVSTLLFTPSLLAKQLRGNKPPQSIDTPKHKLKPGQFFWSDKIALDGPLTAEISLSEQKLYLYRNANLIGVSTVSTGKKKGSTPTGVFTVKGKDKNHISKKYDNTPMPYTHWLTTNGIAIHAGNLPGYRASHGCIRLPIEFARRLFQLSSVGMPVVITRHRLPQ